MQPTRGCVPVRTFAEEIFASEKTHRTIVPDGPKGRGFELIDMATSPTLPLRCGGRPSITSRPRACRVASVRRNRLEGAMISDRAKRRRAMMRGMGAATALTAFHGCSLMEIA